MRKINEVVRTKRVYNLTIEELKEGKWLEAVPNSDKVELEYKGNFLIVKNMESEKEGKNEN